MANKKSTTRSRKTDTSSVVAPVNNGEVLDPESTRLAEDEIRHSNWKRWGPYLSERQWGTVREDYSQHGSTWDYFPHDHARSRAYRWGEDGLLGITDRQCRLCFSFAFWNGADSILKERLFGLAGSEGNHGEDVKELYYYLDGTPTHSYLKALYKYPQTAFPYQQLTSENRNRSREMPEYEIMDTGIFSDNRYFDITVEYAKKTPNYMLMRLTVDNRAPTAAELHLLPTLWFRNSWSWGRSGEAYTGRPSLRLTSNTCVVTEHEALEPFAFETEGPNAFGITSLPTPLFTENETNIQRLFGSPLTNPYVKDAFHEYLIHGRKEAVNPALEGTKAAFHYKVQVPAQGQIVLYLRLASQQELSAGGAIPSIREEAEKVFEARIADADAFYASKLPKSESKEERLIARQAYAGLLWSKQFYYYCVKEWQEGDPTQPAVHPDRSNGRNGDWKHLYNRDVISMPDKWEYPWYAAWDLAFHMIPFARIDPEFAKQQLILLLREWYMHPNGQIPAYEFGFSDVNPPVHAWAVWRVYKLTGRRGQRDRSFLARCFHKLLFNFSWWVNRKDVEGNNLFSGGFLGLDNIGVFDRGQPMPMGGHLEQADGTAWMAFYCGTMLSIALELAGEDPVYEDSASKFFEHFIAITDAINNFGGTGLWDDLDGFYYDRLHLKSQSIPMRVRSLVGIIPMLAVEILDDSLLNRLPDFRKRMEWFELHRPDLARHISYLERSEGLSMRLLAVPSRERLERMLRYVLDEAEFFSAHGIRSLSKVHAARPYVVRLEGQEYRINYVPGESDVQLFGGNSNWRGPIWFPLNYLLIEALERYHHFYGETLKIECPLGSGKFLNLREVAHELSRRLSAIFVNNEQGKRPCHGEDPHYHADPNFKDLMLFYEYFHGDNGKGYGASHQTGWTALITRCLEKCMQGHVQVR